MINLCLVVIATQFSETKRRETERMLAERARQRHRSQSSNSTITSSGAGAGLDVGGCYVEMIRYLEYLANRARRRLARLVRRLRRRYAAGQPASDVPAGRPRSLVFADSSPRRRRRRRRRRYRDLDPRSPDAPDNTPRGPADQTDSTNEVVSSRVGPHAASDTLEVDSLSPSASVASSSHRAKVLTIANAECLQVSNTGLCLWLSRSIV